MIAARNPLPRLPTRDGPGRARPDGRGRSIPSAVRALGLAWILAFAGLPAMAAPSPPLKTGRLALDACLILPSRTADIGTPLAGVIDTVEVERGDAVSQGAILVRLHADPERAQLDVARRRAQSRAELRAAEAAEELARQGLERSRALRAEQFLSSQAVDQAEAEYRLAREKVAQAREALAVSVGESGVTSARVAQRVIRAPFDGIVVERYAQPGERFEEKPLLRLAAIDELRIEIVAPSQLFGRLQVGDALMIRPDLPDQPERPARIVQIDQVLDPASNTFRVRLTLPNPNRDLPAGLRCRARLDDARAGKPPSAFPAPTARAHY